MRFFEALVPAAAFFSGALAQDPNSDPTTTVEVTSTTAALDTTTIVDSSSYTSSYETETSSEEPTQTESYQSYTTSGYSSYSSSEEPVEPSTYTTVITEDYTTYCPSPTTFVHKNVTYSATTETVLTITNCPCTVVHTGTPTETPTASRAPVSPVSPVSPVKPTETPSEETTRAPVHPTTTPSSLPTIAAGLKVNPGFGAVLIAGMAAMAI